MKLTEGEPEGGEAPPTDPLPSGHETAGGREEEQDQQKQRR
jgi:hypothetical protein